MSPKTRIVLPRENQAPAPHPGPKNSPGHPFTPSAGKLKLESTRTSGSAELLRLRARRNPGRATQTSLEGSKILPATKKLLCYKCRGSNYKTGATNQRFIGSSNPKFTSWCKSHPHLNLSTTKCGAGGGNKEKRQ